VSSLKISGSIYIGVRNLDTALAWYKEKFDLRKSSEPVDEEIGDAALVSANGDIFIAFGAPNPANVETQILFVKNVQKTRDRLATRGVNVGPLQTDRQGTHYFEMRDMENNMIEFSEEP
jgi:catechol 2,3-dioxygenase-like lactoylglutathione lyase family enzyme